MWRRLKRFLSRERGVVQAALRWYEPGTENPFGIRVLDVRSFTSNLIATTKDPGVAERFVRLRGSDGRDLISAVIPESTRLAASLRFPHNGAALEGIVSKADSMDVKWDIYIYDSVFLFARSWTGDLWYRAVAQVGSSEITITEIECPRRDADVAPSHVYFLLGSHAMGRVLPHRLPADAPQDPEGMAMMSFSLFGSLACYATFDDITAIPLV